MKQIRVYIACNPIGDKSMNDFANAVNELAEHNFKVEFGDLIKLQRSDAVLCLDGYEFDNIEKAHIDRLKKPKFNKVQCLRIYEW